jgi:hypothetical protein
MKSKGAIFFVMTFVIVGLIAYGVSLYARGFRFDQNNGSIQPNGILVLKSHPDGAQVYINGELNTATDATIPLAPGTYDVEVKKEGFISWSKRLTIKKEEVNEITAHIFKVVPSLSSITFSGAVNPTPSHDGSKIAYLVTPTENNGSPDDIGLWIIETLNLPLGFSREPRKVTDGNLAGATIKWSPNGREILLTTVSGTYLLDAGRLTPQTELTNVANQVDEILIEWEEDLDKKLNDQLKKLPEQMISILNSKASSIVFSPDEDMVIYSASRSATIPDGLKKPLPGSSNQPEDRNIKEYHTYIYDIEEDKNFLIDNASSDLVLTGGYMLSDYTNGSVQETSSINRRLSWFPTSRHVVLAEENKITIMDYDGTNRQVIYSGSYVSPNGFPTVSIDRLLVLTNFGADSAPSNLYSMSLK